MEGRKEVLLAVPDMSSSPSPGQCLLSSVFFSKVWLSRDENPTLTTDSPRSFRCTSIRPTDPRAVAAQYSESEIWKQRLRL